MIDLLTRVQRRRVHPVPALAVVTLKLQVKVSHQFVHDQLTHTSSEAEKSDAVDDDGMPPTCS